MSLKEESITGELVNSVDGEKEWGFEHKKIINSKKPLFGKGCGRFASKNESFWKHMIIWK